MDCFPSLPLPCSPLAEDGLTPLPVEKKTALRPDFTHCVSGPPVVTPPLFFSFVLLALTFKVGNKLHMKLQEQNANTEIMNYVHFQKRETQ